MRTNRTKNTNSTKDILMAAIEAAGGDGLCREDCGCGIDDLMPCDGVQLDCEIAKRKREVFVPVTAGTNGTYGTAEKMILQGLRDSCGAQFSMDNIVPQWTPAGVGACIDGYIPGDRYRPIVLIEVCSHLGKAKSGQERKIRSDMYKLVGIEGILREHATVGYAQEKGVDLFPNCYRKIIAVCCREFITSLSVFTQRQAKRDNIEFVVVDLPKQMLARLARAQRGQAH